MKKISNRTGNLGPREEANLHRLQLLVYRGDPAGNFRQRLEIRLPRNQGPKLSKNLPLEDIKRRTPLPSKGIAQPARVTNKSLESWFGLQRCESNL